MSNSKNISGGASVLQKIKGMTDTNLLLSITIIVFFIMYLSAVLF